MKPRHVLIPIDFSDCSLRALKYGLAVAEVFSAEVSLAHVLVQPAERSAVNEAEERLVSLLPESLRDKVPIRVPLVTCTVEEELLRIASETSADLIVVGTRGLRPFMRFLLGSTTEHLLRVAPIPLMIVTETEEDSGPPSSKVKRILYPTDFSEPTELALPLAVEFARFFKAQLELVHVVDHLASPLGASTGTEAEVARDQEALVSKAESLLEGIAASADDEVNISFKVLQGKPWETIVGHARETQADLIAMSLHGMGFVERALLGSTAERVIRSSPVPVLGIPIRS